MKTVKNLFFLYIEIFTFGFSIFRFPNFSNLPTETWKEVLDFYTRDELAKGKNIVNWLFYTISDKLMYEEREYHLNTYLILDGSQELPTTKKPKNIVVGLDGLDIT